jgi:hypothetical protein
MLFDQITHSTEFLNRNSPSAIGASTVTLLLIEPETAIRYQIVFVTREDMNAVAEVATKIAEQLGPQDRIAILDGSVDETTQGPTSRPAAEQKARGCRPAAGVCLLVSRRGPRAAFNKYQGSAEAFRGLFPATAASQRLLQFRVFVLRG